MIDASFYSFGFDTRFDEVFPHICCQVWCIVVWPFELVDWWVRVVKVIHKVVLMTVLGMLIYKRGRIYTWIYVPSFTLTWMSRSATVIWIKSR